MGYLQQFAVSVLFHSNNRRRVKNSAALYLKLSLHVCPGPTISCSLKNSGRKGTNLVLRSDPIRCRVATRSSLRKWGTSDGQLPNKSIMPFTKFDECILTKS